MMTSTPYPPTIFVLGTRQHVGKTVSSLGVIAKLLSPEYGYTIDEIGYMKPVGQEAVTVTNAAGHKIQVDKDAVLITSLMGIKVPCYEVTSPVIWHGGLTADYIDDQASASPKIDPASFPQVILESYDQVAAGKKVVIIEGTGQPGVGSIGGISSGEVINRLRQKGVPLSVLIVTTAGIGGTIDQIFPFLITMDRLGTRLDGMIINRVFPDKLDRIAHYLNTYYAQLFPKQYGHLMTYPVPPIVGFIPMVPQLSMFSMRLLAEAFARETKTRVEIMAPDNFGEVSGQLIRNIKTINLRFGYERYVEPGDAIIMGVNANDVILSALLMHERYLRNHGQGLAGLILSCNQVGGLSKHVQKLIRDEHLPTIAVEFDSAEIIQQIESWTVKIQPYDVEKRQLISKTYCDNLDLARVLAPRREGQTTT
jgi:dethiobiotin synthetase